MKISIVFQNQSSDKHSLELVDKIGEGKFNVYKAYCPSLQTFFALKVFPKNDFSTTQYKKETLVSNLSHPHLIKYFPINESNTDYNLVLTELAQNRDFFDLIMGDMLNTEMLIRTYFHQLISGLEYLHSQGIAHLDPKPENLLIGSDFSLKIIDFDQSQVLTDNKLTSGGTVGFRAPEVIDGTCTNLAAADIYSLGVILYVSKCQQYPFIEVPAEENNGVPCLQYYSDFLRNNKAFWEEKANLKGNSKFFSENFKELVNGMLECEVDKRFTIKDIKESKWYKGPILDAKTLKTHMEMRFK